MNVADQRIREGRVYFIAEAGINHNADIDLAEELIEIASSAGADAVKFQTFSADRLVAKNADMADYQEERVGDESQREMLRRYELDKADHQHLIDYASTHDITFISTPFDADSARMLADLGVPAIKVGSGELTNHPLLETIANLELPMIVSTGMGTMDEVRAARDAIRSTSVDLPLALLHCTSSYPCSIDDVNLRSMVSMADEFSEPIGYSDHTTHPETPALAVAAGAQIVEKHFTLDSTLSGPDHEASVEPDELERSIRLARLAAEARGTDEKMPVDAEKEMRYTARKSLHASKPLEPGTKLTESDMKIVRPASGIPPTEYEWAVGKRIVRPVDEGAAIERTDLDNT